MGKIYAAHRWWLSLLKAKIDEVIEIDMDAMGLAGEDMVDEARQGKLIFSIYLTWYFCIGRRRFPGLPV